MCLALTGLCAAVWLLSTPPEETSTQPNPPLNPPAPRFKVFNCGREGVFVILSNFRAPPPYPHEPSPTAPPVGASCSRSRGPCIPITDITQALL